MFGLIAQGEYLLVALLLVALVLSLSCHEFAHAYVAKLFGDDTAERAGRLTLNPVRHIEPFGLLLVMAVGFAMPSRCRRIRATSAAAARISGWPPPGPGMNLLLAVLAWNLFALLLLGRVELVSASGVQTFFVLFVQINLLLMVFNLIRLAVGRPLHPAVLAAATRGRCVSLLQRPLWRVAVARRDRSTVRRRAGVLDLDGSGAIAAAPDRLHRRAAMKTALSAGASAAAGPDAAGTLPEPAGGRCPPPACPGPTRRCAGPWHRSARHRGWRLSPWCQHRETAEERHHASRESGSRLPVGSSASNTLGLLTTARAIADALPTRPPKDSPAAGVPSPASRRWRERRGRGDRSRDPSGRRPARAAQRSRTRCGALANGALGRPRPSAGGSAAGALAPSERC